MLEQQFKTTRTTLMTRTLLAPQTKRKFEVRTRTWKGETGENKQEDEEEGKRIYWIEAVQTRREAPEVQRKG